MIAIVRLQVFFNMRDLEIDGLILMLQTRFSARFNSEWLYCVSDRWKFADA